MFAAAIGIDRAVKADVGGIVSSDDLPGGIDGDRGFERWQLVEGAPAVIKSDSGKRLIAARSVALRAATPAALMVDHNTEQLADVFIGARRRGGQLLHRRASLGCV